MRCYFVQSGHIADVEVLELDGSDVDAIQQARGLFRERKERFEGFEVWDLARCVYRFAEMKPGQSVTIAHGLRFGR
jgi:hypothetical protein